MTKRTEEPTPSTREPAPGTRKWWAYYAIFEIHGPVDTILRLLEQGLITRTKARELMEFAIWGRIATGTLPRAPWEELNWANEEEK